MVVVLMEWQRWESCKVSQNKKAITVAGDSF